MRISPADGLMRFVATFWMLALLAGPAVAQTAGPQMPDAKQMSGVPLPAGELAPGTLTVRVIRGSLSSPLQGIPVEITGELKSTGKTGDTGRAEFRVRPGARVKATAIVDGETLASQEIVMPATGGVRVMLVATDPESARRAEEDRRLAQGPAQRGVVVLGDQSRFVIELGDESLSVFNIIQILNTARVPVEPPSPLIFELPAGAGEPGLMEGSSPLAAASRGSVRVAGPFPPGATLVQFAYSFPYSGSAASFRQVMPAQLAQLTVVVQKIGDMRVASGQLAQQRDVAAEGQSYIFGQGPALAAGSAFELSLSGLPHTAVWPRNLALTLVVLILVAGAFVSVRSSAPDARSTDVARLQARRDRLFDELTSLEQSHRAGRVDPIFYGARRRQLVAALERVYAALDQAAAA